jgi:hypothetical protein
MEIRENRKELEMDNWKRKEFTKGFGLMHMIEGRGS